MAAEAEDGGTEREGAGIQTHRRWSVGARRRRRRARTSGPSRGPSRHDRCGGGWGVKYGTQDFLEISGS